MPPPVVWIGGLTGSGKTTVARRLAQRWGLRLYAADSRTWEHRDRAIAAGVAGAIRYESLTQAERLASSPADRRAMWLGDERAVMVVDDVRQLPASPLVVAEGDVIAPHLIEPSRGVWLDPTAEFQLRHRWAEYIGIGHSADDARRSGVQTVTVDGSLSVRALVDEVERVLAVPLRAGPCAGSVDERRALLREANLDGVAQVRAGCARPWSTAEPESQVRSFLCECGSSACASDVEATVAAAATEAVVAEGHL